MSNLYSINDYIKLSVSRYLKDAHHSFNLTNPTIGSDILARSLLEYALLRMVGSLEQKINNMSWYIGFHDIENSNEIHSGMYSNILKVDNLNKLHKRFIAQINREVPNAIWDYHELLLEAIAETYAIISPNEDYSCLVNYTNSEYQNSLKPCLLYIIQHTGNLRLLSKVRTDHRAEYNDFHRELRPLYEAAIDFRNQIAHNNASIYKTQNDFSPKNNENYLTKRFNIYHLFVVLLYIDKVIRLLFSEADEKIQKSNIKLY